MSGPLSRAELVELFKTADRLTNAALTDSSKKALGQELTVISRALTETFSQTEREALSELSVDVRAGRITEAEAVGSVLLRFGIL